MAERDPKEGDGPLTRGAVLKTRVASRYKPLRDEALESSEESDDELELEPDPDPDPPLQGNCCRCIREDLPHVMPERIQEAWKRRTMYQAHLPGAGIFQCSITGLGFKVKSAVTIAYRYATWSRHLSEADEEMWAPAGPLFHIRVQPGVVQEVHLPHFICLAEGADTDLCSIAHFKSEKMNLEKPTRVDAFSAVLRNPSFSLLGVLWRKLRSTLNSFPMHSLVLIYHQLGAADTTFHFYLIPDDNSVKQAIENQEKDWDTKLIPKPPPVSPLFFGCIYQVTTTVPDLVVITPAYLPFCYRSPKEQQLFVEIYIKDMVEEIKLLMTNTRDNTNIWRATLRRGDINPSPFALRNVSGAAFLKKHKAKLCSRMRQLTILPHLRNANVINSDEEEELQSQKTRVRRNLILLDLIEKKGLESQEQFYRILCLKDPYLVADLEYSS